MTFSLTRWYWDVAALAGTEQNTSIEVQLVGVPTGTYFFGLEQLKSLVRIPTFLYVSSNDTEVPIPLLANTRLPLTETTSTHTSTGTLSSSDTPTSMFLLLLPHQLISLSAAHIASQRINTDGVIDHTRPVYRASTFIDCSRSHHRHPDRSYNNTGRTGQPSAQLRRKGRHRRGLRGGGRHRPGAGNPVLEAAAAPDPGPEGARRLPVRLQPAHAQLRSRASSCRRWTGRESTGAIRQESSHVHAASLQLRQPGAIDGSFRPAHTDTTLILPILPVGSVSQRSIRNERARESDPKLDHRSRAHTVHCH